MTLQNGKYKIGVEHRLSGLEGNIDHLRSDIDEIKTNHLAHLRADLVILSGRVWAILGTIILGILVTIATRVW